MTSRVSLSCFAYLPIFNNENKLVNRTVSVWRQGAYRLLIVGPLHLIDLLQSAIDLFWFKYRITTGRDLNCNNWNLMNIKSQKLITFRGSRTMFRRMKVPIARYLFSRVLQGDPLLRKPFRKFSLKKN